MLAAVRGPIYGTILQASLWSEEEEERQTPAETTLDSSLSLVSE